MNGHRFGVQTCGCSQVPILVAARVLRCSIAYITAVAFQLIPGFLLLNFTIIVLLIHVPIALLVYRDAGSRELNSILWSVAAVTVPIVGLVIYLIARQNLRTKGVKSFLMISVVVGVVLSGLVGALHAQSLHLECASRTSEPEVVCVPLDVGMVFLSGFYILMFLAVTAPLVLLSTIYFRSR